MERKIIENNNLTMLDYPIGTHISQNMERISLMGDLLSLTISSMEEYKDKRINLVCSGSSGSIIAALISAKIKNVVITHIKKQGEDSHSSSISILKNDKIIIVDDFISSGKTMNFIYERLSASGYNEVNGLVVTSEVSERRLNFSPNEIVICYKFY